MCKKYLIGVLLLFFNLSLVGQNIDIEGLKDIETLRLKCGEMIEHFVMDESSEAFKLMKEITIIAPDEIDNLETQTIKNLNLLERNYGEIIGSKFVREEIIDSVLIRRTYVVKFERYGVRMMFTFYNGKNENWFLNAFVWDDTLTKLFNE